MIDSRIALGLNPPQYVSPLETAGKALTLRSLLDERDLREIQKQKIQREFSDDDALRAASVEAGGDPRRLSALLYQRGLPTKALAIEKQVVDTDRARAGAQKDASQVLKETAEHFRNRLATVKDDASLEAFRAEVASNPLLASHAARLPSRFDPQWKMGELQTASNLLSQNQPKFERQDVGGKVVMVDMNPFTNPALASQILEKSMTPGEVATDTRSRAQLAEQQRHNRTTEGISAGNLGVARERLEIDRNQPRGQYDAERGVLVDPRTGEARPVTMGGQPMPTKLTSTQRDELMSVDRTRAAAGRLKEMFKPEFVGFKGTIGEFWDQYGSQAVPGAEGNAERIQFRALAADTENQYIKAISGATVPTSEVPRLRRAIPVPSDSPARYKAKLHEMERNLAELPAIISRSGSAPRSTGASGGWAIKPLP